MTFLTKNRIWVEDLTGKMDCFIMIKTYIEE